MARLPVRYPSQRQGEAVGLRGIAPLLSIADMRGGELMPIKELIGHFSDFGWDETFLRTGRLAALLANGHDHENGPVWRATHASLLPFFNSPNPRSRRLAAYA